MKLCPTSKKEWDDAARRKDCSSIASKQNCSSVEQFQYHCVIDGYRRFTFEVCAPTRIIFGNFFFQSCTVIANQLLFNFKYFWEKFYTWLFHFQDTVQNLMSMVELFRIRYQPPATINSPNAIRIIDQWLLTNVRSKKSLFSITCFRLISCCLHSVVLLWW